MSDDEAPPFDMIPTELLVHPPWMPVVVEAHCLHWRGDEGRVIDCCRCGARDVSLEAAGVPMIGRVRLCGDGTGCAVVMR